MRWSCRAGPTFLGGPLAVGHFIPATFSTESRSGEIDSSEFEVILKRLSIKASSEQIEELISAMDYTQSGSIGFGEFVRMLAG